MISKIEIESISTYELEQLMRRVTREELQNVVRTDSTINSKNSSEDELIPRAKFLKITGKSESWLSKNMSKGIIPYHRIGRSIFFRISEVLAHSKNSITFKNLRRKKHGNEY